MKKLITGAVAALVLLFGFASCSGDLHDNDVQPLGIVGLTADAGNHVIPMKLDKADGSEQSLTFTLKDGFELEAADGKKYKLTSAAKDSWRYNNGNGPITVSRFKVVSKIMADGTPDWNSDYGSLNKDDPQYITAGEDFQKVGKRGDANVSGDPAHLVLDGAIEGETYVLRAKYNAAAGTLELKLDGTKNDPAGVKFIFADDYKNFPKKDAAGKDLSYSMARAGNNYTYQFVSIADETISFDVTNAMVGKIGSKSLTVKTNVGYKISVDASNGLSSKSDINVEEIDCIEAGKAGVSGDYIYSGVYYTQATASNGVSFKPTNDTFKFKILRDTTSEYPYWGKGSESFEIGKTYSPAYCADDSVTAKPDYIEVKGLIPGKPYRLQIDNNKDPAKITVTVKKVSEDYKWFWIQAPADSKATVIFNDCGTENYQTDNMKDFLNTKKKTVVYEWLADGSKENAKESNRTDYPKNVLEEKDGFVNIYVYANCTKVSVYAWGANAGAGGELFGGWSGTRMCSDDYDPNIKATVKTIEFKNFEGKKLYALDGKLPGNDWSINTPNVIDLTNNAGTMTLSGDLEITSEYSIQIVVDPKDASSFWQAKVWAENEVQCPKPTKTGNYKLVADGTAKTLTLVEL